MAQLEIIDLCVSYGQAIALSGVSLEVRSKECVGLIGPNGAGKTTLLRSISGLKTWSGEIRFDNQSLKSLPTSEIVKHGIVQAPEGRHLFSQLSVGENLDMGAFLLKDKDLIRRNRESVLKLFPRLNERIRQTAGTLSGGEQQMLSVGRALMAAPKLLMLDEPSFGLAPLIKDIIGESILEIRNIGVTILLVEQDANMAFELSQRIYVLEEGGITLEGSSGILSEDPRIKSSYLGLD